MVTGTLAKDYLRHYEVPDKKIFLLPYAVDNTAISESCKSYRAQRHVLRNELRIPSDAMVLLAVIKLVPREGGMDLIKAFANLEKSISKLWLIIVGDGPQKQDLHNHVSALGIQNVTFAGYQPYSRLSKYFALADVFIHPALFEPWGVSVNEAMACGLPIIASDSVGASYDLIRSGENGFVYHAGDAESLRQAIVKFLDSSEKNMMGQRSLEMIQPWNYDMCLNELQKVLGQIK